MMMMLVVGVSSWTAPLPDIALHTIDPNPPGWHSRDTGAETPERTPSKAVILKSRLVRAATISSTITHCRSAHKRVNLNVGGIKHEVMWKMLEQV